VSHRKKEIAEKEKTKLVIKNIIEKFASDINERI